MKLVTDVSMLLVQAQCLAVVVIATMTLSKLLGDTRIFICRLNSLIISSLSSVDRQSGSLVTVMFYYIKMFVTDVWAFELLHCLVNC